MFFSINNDWLQQINLKKTREISCYQTNVYVDYLELS